MKKEITDINEAMNILYGIDDGQVDSKFIKLVIDE